MVMAHRSTTRHNSILCPKPRWGTSRRLGWHGDNDSTPDYSDCRDRPLPSKKYNMQTSVRYRRKKILAAALSSITSGTSLKLQLIASCTNLENISTYYITLENISTRRLGFKSWSSCACRALHNHSFSHSPKAAAGRHTTRAMPQSEPNSR